MKYRCEIPIEIQEYTHMQKNVKILCGSKISFNGYLDIKKMHSNKHSCYIIKSIKYSHVYIGYTVDFKRRLRQHNREIAGGANKTLRYYPYYPICVIKGFPDAYTAHSFEWHLQHLRGRRKTVRPYIKPVILNMINVIENGTGSVSKGTKRSWPHLHLHWYSDEYNIEHVLVTNHY